MREFNYRAIKEWKWSAEILNLIAQIHEHKGRQDLYLARKPELLDKLVEIAKIQSVEDSNKIEGIVTTKLRMTELIQEKVQPRNRDEEEISGYRDVLTLIHENYDYIPINPSHILQFHRHLYAYSGRDIGGKFKNTQNTITETLSDGRQIERFRPLAPFETPQAIEDICQEYKRALDEGVVDGLLLIPIFIHDFLCIHPFNDGNGRMSRLLTTLLLYQQGYVIGKYISLESKIEKTKLAYYESLERSGIAWHENQEDVTPFISYILGIILSAYRDFESRVDYMEEKTPSLDRVQAHIQTRIGKFTKSDLVEDIPSLSRASIENALKKLTEGGVIERHGKGKSTFYVRRRE